MNKQEAIEFLEINEDEINAIECYKGAQHISMNVLLNYTSKIYEKMGRGINLPKDPEYLDHLITNFGNLYSAMCKELLNKGDKYFNEKGFKKVLYRGTSDKSIRKDNKPYTVNKFISTSFDESKAKSFAKYDNPALIEFEVKNDIPFLIVGDYLEDDDYENNYDENEVIFSPFAFIKAQSVEHQPSKDYKYYNAVLTPGKLESISKKEQSKLRKEILSDIEEHANRVQEQSPLFEQIRCLETRVCDMNLSSKEAIEDYNDMQEDIKTKKAELEKIEGQSKRFVSKLDKLLQGICKDKEDEITDAYKIIKYEELKEIENIKSKEIRTCKDNLKLGLNAARELPSLINKFSDDMSYMQDIVNSKRLALGLDVDERNSVRNTTLVESRVIKIEKNINKFLSSFDMKKIEANIDEKGNSKSVKEIIKKLDSISQIVNKFNQNIKLPEEYRKTLEINLKKELFNTVRKMIINAKKASLEFEMEEILAYKIGFLGRFNGEEELKNLQVENMGLKMRALSNEILEADVIIDKFDIDIDSDELLVCALAYINDVKKNTPGYYNDEMEEIFNNIKKEYGITYKETSSKYLEKYLKEKLELLKSVDGDTEKLPILKPKKQIFFKSKRKLEIEKLRLENSNLKNKILYFDMNNSLAKFDYDEVETLKEIIEEALEISKALIDDNSNNEEEKDNIDVYNEQVG